MAIPIRDDSPTRSLPWVTIGLILANVVIFLFLQPAVLQGGNSDSETFNGPSSSEVQAYDIEWGVVPCELQERKSLADGAACGDRQPIADVAPKVVLLSLLTHMFIHGSILHLAGNMLFLWVFGAAVEDRIKPLPYMLLYLTTGMIAVLGHSIFHFDDMSPVLGASGAIAGLMGAYLVFRPRGRVLSIVFWTVVYLPAWMLLGLFFATQFLTPDSDGVAWEAHAIGMASGFLIALILAQFFPDPLAPPAPPARRESSADWTMPVAPPY